MKTTILCFLILLSPVICLSQSKFSSGISTGLISINKENGLNENLFIAYKTSKNIDIGVDATFGQIKLNDNTFKTNLFLGYIEAGNADKGFFKNKFYFSAIIGLGYTEQKIDVSKNSTGTFFAGTKLNYNLNKNCLLGIKSGYYFSHLENVIIANLFFTYKFQ